jgi:succinate-semialdehyde dehydrogenase/glutarate-semialdehyde dehydrogenase
MSQSSASLKKLSLELGGNSPFIIFDDCDVNAAVDALITAKIRNSGQTCVCANRIYVQEGVYDKVSQLLVERMKQLKVGAGFDAGVNIGPLMHEGAVNKAAYHVDDAVSKGAQVLLGGKPWGGPSGKGFFFEPTVIANMKPDMLSYREEVFAPVAPLYRFKTEEEVLALANGVDVGLGSYVCTNDIARMWRVAEELEVGLVAVNGGLLAAVESPFGGVKWSGFGKEGGRYGIEEFLVVKSVVISVPR